MVETPAGAAAGAEGRKEGLAEFETGECDGREVRRSVDIVAAAAGIAAAVPTIVADGIAEIVAARIVPAATAAAAGIAAAAPVAAAGTVGDWCSRGIHGSCLGVGFGFGTEADCNCCCAEGFVG